MQMHRIFGSPEVRRIKLVMTLVIVAECPGLKGDFEQLSLQALRMVLSINAVTLMTELEPLEVEQIHAPAQRNLERPPRQSV